MTKEILVKKVIVLMLEDANEAMRVAAGLTIFGHEVGCVVLNRNIDIASDNEYLEMLDLADIEPVILIDSQLKSNNSDDAQPNNAADRQAQFQPIGDFDFKQALHESDVILSF